MRYIQEHQRQLTSGKYMHYLVQITKRGSYGNLTYIVKRILHSGKFDKHNVFEYSSGDVEFKLDDFVKAVKLAFSLATLDEVVQLLPYIEISSLVKFDELQLLQTDKNEKEEV